MIRVKVGSGMQLRAVGDSLGQLEPALNAIGALVLSKTQEAWKNQAYGGSPWRERLNPNYIGIVSDLESNSNPKPRRFTSRPAGVDTGNLRNSFKPSDPRAMQISGNSVTVGTHVEYAQRFQDGGKSTLKFTAAGKDRLAKWLRGKPQEMRDSLGWLFGVDAVHVNSSPRPFLKWSSSLARFVNAELEQVLERQLRRAVRERS